MNENHTYITCLFKKKGKRKGKEITRPILSTRFVENRGNRSRLVGERMENKHNHRCRWFVERKRRKEREKERKGEKSRSIDRVVRSRWNRRGSSPLVRGRQSYFSSAIETLDAAKKGPVTEENFERFEPLLPPLLPETRTEDARTRSVAGGDRATTKKNIRLIHFRSPVAVCTFFFFIFRFIIPSFILDPDEAAIEKSTLSPKCFFFTLSLSAPSTS